MVRDESFPAWRMVAVSVAAAIANSLRSIHDFIAWSIPVG
jgi:hypothetical protein